MRSVAISSRWLVIGSPPATNMRPPPARQATGRNVSISYEGRHERGAGEASTGSRRLERRVGRGGETWLSGFGVEPTEEEQLRPGPDGGVEAVDAIERCEVLPRLRGGRQELPRVGEPRNAGDVERVRM